jgi:hypothetical protein
MGRGIDRSLRLQSRPFVGCHLDPNLVGDRVRDLALELENVGEASLVAFAHELRSLATSTNWTVMRTRSPTRSAEPSTTPSTRSSRAISLSGGWVPLKRIAEVPRSARGRRLTRRSCRRRRTPGLGRPSDSRRAREAELTNQVWRPEELVGLVDTADTKAA